MDNLKKTPNQSDITYSTEFPGALNPSLQILQSFLMIIGITQREIKSRHCHQREREGEKGTQSINIRTLTSKHKKSETETKEAEWINYQTFQLEGKQK